MEGEIYIIIVAKFIAVLPVWTRKTKTHAGAKASLGKMVCGPVAKFVKFMTRVYYWAHNKLRRE